MRITQDVRKYAQEHGLGDEAALDAGMAEMSAQFRASGDRVYLPIAD
jgi:phosphomethylpyrimidine synthase